MRPRGGAVYILTNRRRTVLYTGVTADLARRVWQHQAGIAASSFTSRYRTDVLVYYEAWDDIVAAIRREKQIKGWTRQKKITLIESMNPTWADLWAHVTS
jgi:putative endonuclease